MSFDVLIKKYVILFHVTYFLMSCIDDAEFRGREKKNEQENNFSPVYPVL